MAEYSGIHWTDHTFNPWIGCQKVGPGCDHCYAEVWDNRFDGSRWGPHAVRTRTKVQNWNKVRRWNRKAAEKGIREKVFVASLADVCDTHGSINDEWRRDLGKLVEECQNLDFLFLTKRAGNIRNALAVIFPDGVPQNLWMGITVVNQDEADRDIVKLMMAKAYLDIRVAFLSIEPMLGAIDLTNLKSKIDGEAVTINCLTGEIWHDESTSGAAYSGPDDGVPLVDWVICGGESGAKARPIHPSWAESLALQCQSTGAEFHFKQWGSWSPDPDLPSSYIIGYDGVLKRNLGQERNVGDVEMTFTSKEAAGRLLMGRTWDGVPA